MRKKGRICLMLGICAVLAWNMGLTAQATEQKIEDTKEKLNELEEKKKQAQQKAAELENTQKTLSGDLETMDSELAKISASLTELEQKIVEKQSTIEETKKQLKKAKKREKSQYQSMKSRIKYVYEHGNDSLWTAILEAESISDFISRTEYVEAIAGYDREKLEEYRALRDKIAGDQKKLEEEQQQLKALKEDTKNKQQQMNTLIASTKESISRSEKEKGEAQKLAQSYEEEIEKQKAYEAQLEAQKAQEDAARMNEIKQQEAEGANGADVQAQEGDLPLLAALIECEAGGESYEGKLAVGSVVLNRVASSYFPNTVVGVIYQSGQFSPVASGRFATVLARGANASCTQAAQEVLNGKITINALYFRQNNGTIQGTVIGNHVFY